MRKKATRKRPYFTMESAMTAILRDASGKMHHGILFARRLVKPVLSRPHIKQTPCMMSGPIAVCVKRFFSNFK